MAEIALLVKLGFVQPEAVDDVDDLRRALLESFLALLG
jgi:hypothetical protein